MLVAALVGLGLGQVAADADVLPEEDLAVVLQPVEHLFDVVLEEAQRQFLVQLDLLLAPLLLQLPVVVQDLVVDGQHVRRPLRVVLGRVRRQRPRFRSRIRLPATTNPVHTFGSKK